MIEGCRDKAGGLVTHVALLIGWHMSGRRRLARCRSPIVTGRAIAGYTRMVEIRTGKGRGVMAGRAIRAGAVMHSIIRRILVWKISCDMTRCAIAGNSLVIKGRRLEAATRCMAGAAITRGRNMWWVKLHILTDGIDPVTAIATNTGHLGAAVIEKTTDKSCRVMTYRAITVGLNMVRYRVLAGNSSKGTGVAGITTHAQHIRSAVINILRRPC